MPSGPNRRDSKRPRRPAPGDKPAERDFIAENLRALFENAAGEPLPEPLTAFLARLAAEERGK